MDPLGTAALAAVVAAGLGAVLAPEQRRGAWLCATTGAWWAAVVVLAVRFATVDLRLAAVASLTRHEVPVPLRIAGVWAGPAGSAVLWFAVVLAVVCVAVGRDGRARAARLLGGASAAGGLVVLAVAGPFDRVVEPVVSGRGLSPVLEHPLMVAHPPLLYVAQAAVLAAALTGHTGGDRTDRARRLTAAALALLIASTLLGAWWAHDELGWGGWWAWDPVENTALAPLVALVASLHARTRRARTAWCDAAGVAVLAGIALTRSGLPRSVHAFSSGRTLAAAFLLGAVAASVAVIVRGRRDDGVAGAESGSDASAAGPWSPASVGAAVLSIGAGWILVVVGAAGVAAVVLGVQDPPAAVDGRMLGRLVAPAGVLVAGALVAFGFRRGHRAPALVAHAGALVFGLGVVGSLASSTQLVTVDLGVPHDVDGTRIEVRTVRVVEERRDLVRLEAVVAVDGRTVRAAILDHPDLAATRARPGRLVDWRGETEVVLLTVRGERVRVELRRHPGLLYVWVGGGACALGAAAAAQDRRRRLASSSESSVEPDEPLVGPSD